MTVNSFKIAPEGGLSSDPVAINSFVRSVARVVNNILRGKINAVGEVTLAANGTSTVVEDVRMSANSLVLFDPLTSNAAAELYGATMYVADDDRRNGQFTISHANNAQTDRTFKYLIIA